MNILIITGIKEELELFISRNSATFRSELRCFQLPNQPGVFCMTGGPGIRKKKEIRRVLRDVRPQIVVSAGLVGLLNGDLTLKSGSLAQIKGITDGVNSCNVQNSFQGHNLISIDKPIFSPSEKMDFLDETGADFCDMEMFPLYALLVAHAKEANNAVSLCPIKVIGDRPEDFDLYRFEHELRGMKLATFRQIISASRGFSGGYWRFARLVYKKKRQYYKLTLYLEKFIRNIQSAENAISLNCFFIPTGKNNRSN